MSYNHSSQFTSLIRTDTRSSVSTNATAPNLPGPGRILGLLLDRVGKRIESFLNRCANRSGMGPVATAREIRLLRRYGELTIQERYSLPPIQLSKRETKKLKKRCDTLLKFVGSRILSTQLDALEQVMALSMEDSLLRAIFAECRLDYLEPLYNEPNLLLTSMRALASIQETATHELWSPGLKHLDKLFEDPTIEQLKKSLFDKKLSFIGARYLSDIIQSNPQMDSEIYKLLVASQLIETYVEVASMVWLEVDVEWANLSKCLCGILKKRGFKVGLPTMLHFFSGLVRYEDEREHIVERIVDSSFIVENGVYNLKNAGIFGWNLDECTSFCLTSLSMLSGSKDIYEQLSFIQRINAKTRRLLEGTTFLDDLCIAYYHLKSLSPSTLPIESWVTLGFHLELPKLGPALSVLVQALDETNSPFRRLVAEFLIRKFCSLSRYCKLALCLENTLSSRPCLGPLSLGEIGIQIDRPTKSSLKPKREYFIRLTVDGICRFVTRSCDFRSPSQLVEINIQRWYGSNICADVLICDHCDLVDIKVGAIEHFDATGHFPILMGFDESNRALYFANVDDFEACVVEGSTSAVFTNNKSVKETKTCLEFNVRALRFDPSDANNTVSSRRDIRGAMDPTGPLHWRRFWPTKDPSLRTLMADNWHYTCLKEKIILFFDKCARRAAQLPTHMNEHNGIASEREMIEDHTTSDLRSFANHRHEGAKNDTESTESDQYSDDDDRIASHQLEASQECNDATKDMRKYTKAAIPEVQLDENDGNASVSPHLRIVAI
ncbi:hypothetical protein SCHPADRAFT_981278 [Schizopora paradoxa]|uniref:Uncharacterized protein n=1 Tax=Schizopora paradoxa TaxID=27342 RepID=A0A0H2RAH4_9AGAM|nr:hypothetical protein SCHPADRAFT_981278 [Schizopora paradoxa]